MIGYSGRMEKVDRQKKSTKSYRRGGETQPKIDVIDLKYYYMDNNKEKQ